MTTKTFLDALETAWPVKNWCDVTVVVAVSGGADSVALLTGLHRLKQGGVGKLRVAHFNHGTRAAESEADEWFVRELAEQLPLPCLAGRAADGLAAWDGSDGFEAAARAARYEFLTNAARQAGARYVVTAHTADDQVETILHRILRGTGVAGLAGIPRSRMLAPGITLLRPLLGIRRQMLRDFLAETGQAWREDASNALHDRTRNRIRGELLPLLAAGYSPAVTESLLRLSDLAREAQETIDEEANALVESCVKFISADEVSVDTTPLQGRSAFLVCEFFIALWRRQNWPRQDYGRDEWRRLAAMALGPPTAAAETLPGAVLARRRGDILQLSRAT